MGIANIGLRHYPSENHDYSEYLRGVHGTYNKNNDDEKEESEDEDTRDPSHECLTCGNDVYIPSETRTHAPHWCDDCEDVKKHTKI